jgi:hypothetical protein
MSDWRWDSTRRPDDAFWRGCWTALLLVVPVWVLLGLGVYWLGQR